MVICVEDNFAGEKSLNVSRIKMICGQDHFAGEKVIEYFRINDDLRLRQLSVEKVFE